VSSRPVAAAGRIGEDLIVYAGKTFRISSEGRMKLEYGKEPYQISLWRNASVYLFEGGHDPEKRHLSVKDAAGNDVLTVYGLTPEMMAQLYVDIGQALGKAPNVTLQHLKKLYHELDATFNVPHHFENEPM
jgi:hypothetical protein